MTPKISRRQWTALALGGIGSLFIPSVFAASNKKNDFQAWPELTGSNHNMVLGIQSYSFRDRTLAETIKAMVQAGVKSCELWEGHVEPRELQWAANQDPEMVRSKNEQLRKWRDELSMDDIHAIRTQFDEAGIQLQAYNGTIKDNISDHDLELLFKIAQALGVKAITTSATVSVMKRVDPYAKKYKIIVAIHNHAHTEKANEFSSPDTFARAMAGLSGYIWINLDIGHFTAAGFDALEYIREHHQKIYSIHIKDRKKNQGINMPLGQGDTPIVQVLQLIRDRKWPIPANIEYEYKGGDTIEEVNRCLKYCREAINS